MSALTPYLLWIKLGAIVALVLGLYGAGRHQGAKSVQAKWDAANLARAEADKAAVLARVKDNATIAAKQDAANITLTKAKDAELAPVIKRIYVDRVRVGPALCSGVAAPTKAEDATSSNSADPGPRLVSERTEADFRELERRVEEAMATGRACQAWGKDNGFVP